MNMEPTANVEQTGTKPKKRYQSSRPKQNKKPDSEAARKLPDEGTPAAQNTPVTPPHDTETVDELPRVLPDQSIVRIVITRLPSKKTKSKDVKEGAENVTDKDETEKVRETRVLTVTKSDLETLKQHQIFPMKFLEYRFPNAVLKCACCNLHFAEVGEAYKHAKTSRHVEAAERVARSQTVHILPKPTENMKESLTRVVTETAADCSVLGREDLDLRALLVAKLRDEVRVRAPNISFELYGSSATGLGFKTSDVNLSASCTDDLVTPGEVLQTVYEILRDSPLWSNLQLDYSTFNRVPTLWFQDEDHLLKLSVTVDRASCQTSLLLKQYVELEPRFTTLAVAFRLLARNMQLDRPESGTLSPHVFPLLVLYFLQQKKLVPVLHELSPNKDDPESYASAAEYEASRQSSEQERSRPGTELSVGRLWIDLLRFYVLDFNYSTDVVTVRRLKPTKEDLRLNRGAFAIEDPFHRRISLGYTKKSKTRAFFHDSLIRALIYFNTPQLGTGPLFKQLVRTKNGYHGNQILTPKEASELMNQLKEPLRWDFQAPALLEEKKIKRKCKACKEREHLMKQCPLMQVPKVETLPTLDSLHMEALDKVCERNFTINSPTKKDREKRKMIKRDLERCVRDKWEDAQLTLFGSSTNSFGFWDSDVDVCLTLQSNPNAVDLDYDLMVSRVARILRNNGRIFRDVIPIRNAKVPIVKVIHAPTGLEIDISLYNQLAISNSHLLSCYAAVDPRVQLIGYMAKVLAKQCEIGDASQGSLSSYAYTLMAIHYLQRTNPPVIPVLQELYPAGEEKPQRMVEGWNTWFFDNIPDLAAVWPGFGQNKETASSLWLGFLRYYAESFDFEHQVVCIRRMKPLTKLEKAWGGAMIAVEDPFRLTHNLGTGVSPQMGAYIRRIFVRALRLFHTPVRKIPQPFKDLHEYWFHPDTISKELPPKKAVVRHRNPGQQRSNGPKKTQKPLKKPAAKAVDRKTTKETAGPGKTDT